MDMRLGAAWKEEQLTRVTENKPLTVALTQMKTMGFQFVRRGRIRKESLPFFVVLGTGKRNVFFETL